MRLAKDLIDKPIISVSDGRFLGKVKDIYVDAELTELLGVYIGSEGLIKRKSLLVARDSVVVFGIDAVLVKNSEAVSDDRSMEGVDAWVRLEKLRGRQVDTPGGTKLGTVGDILVDENGRITGFSLSRVYVEGPIAQEGYVSREALIDTGSEDKTMTIDLPRQEKLYLGAEGESETAVPPVPEADDHTDQDENDAVDA